MEKRDREAVVKIIKATEMFTPEEIVAAEEQLDIYLDRPNQKDYELVVAEDKNHQVIGYLSFGHTPLTEGTYDLYWIAVSPEKQGQGYGKALALWLEEEVSRRVGRMIIVETSSQQKYANTRQFYLRLGYEEASRIADFYRYGDDRITYVKCVN